MAIYTEKSTEEFGGKKFYRVTATPESIPELIKLLWYAIRYPKKVQFRTSMEKEFFDKTMKPNDGSKTCWSDK